MGDGDLLRGDLADIGFDLHPCLGGLGERAGEERVCLSVGAEPQGIWPLDDKDDGCSLATIEEVNEFLQVPAAA